ncbi:hypothetical protein CAC42_6140 [Sphaceloma murrayae]|uniref:Sister chromatid cohesion protein DCC1 n=1 Tax=Sphaceloma murrayae TaxID=2082308 RepID=A0A2K1QTW0_9PEZI|nr:hypothetical protein CAC42_6140 [Sphaceloma murrayae]
MSTQKGYEVPLAISSAQESFRLVELPPDLVELLAANPAICLQFKSSVSGQAALCLPAKTFQLRQVQTSNDVHIVKPSMQASHDISDLITQSIVSISQCTSVLELDGESKESALAHLKQTLPTYQEDQDLGLAGQSKSKRRIFADVPLSEGECEVAWSQICAFETGEDRRSFRPSPRSIVKAWSSIISTAILDGIDLAVPISRDRLTLLIESIDEAPQELLQAIISNVSTSSPEKVELKRDSLLALTGVALLEDVQEVGRDEFLRQWHNLVPERWRASATLEALPPMWHMTSTGIIRPIMSSDTSENDGTQTGATASGKRKWHERFKQARKQK